MITLEEYKNYLINNYKYEIDNSKRKQNKRKAYLSKHYKDDYLNKIIIDTLRIIEKIKENTELNYYYIQLKEPYLIIPISLKLYGGWHSDIIYEDINNHLISEYILRKILGEELIIGIKVHEHEFTTVDHEVLYFDNDYYLNLHGIQTIKTKKLLKQKIKNKTNV